MRVNWILCDPAVTDPIPSSVTTTCTFCKCGLFVTAGTVETVLTMRGRWSPVCLPCAARSRHRPPVIIVPFTPKACREREAEARRN